MNVVNISVHLVDPKIGFFFQTWRHNNDDECQISIHYDFDIKENPKSKKDVNCGRSSEVKRFSLTSGSFSTYKTF